MPVRTQRDRALIALVGNVRAFVQQVTSVGGELLEAQEPGDAVLLKLLAELTPRLQALDSLGTSKLREME